MKKLSIALLAFFMAFAGHTQEKIAVIPEPVSLVAGTGTFTLPGKVTIGIPAKADLGHTIGLLQSKIELTGATVQKQEGSATATINLILNKSRDTKIGDEGYTLSVTANSVNIKANKPAGLFYGVQTFLQLLPPQIESKEKVSGIAWQAPVVEITDYPRVGWRGLMLDVSRHFFTVAEVKQYIDDMSRFKYNMFHFHLTDDEGWRLQIKSLPKLTEVGAWRIDRTGLFNTFSPAEPGEKNPMAATTRRKILKTWCNTQRNGLSISFRKLMCRAIVLLLLPLTLNCPVQKGPINTRCALGSPLWTGRMGRRL